MIPDFIGAVRQEMTGHPDGALSMASCYVLVRCMGAEKLEKSYPGGVLMSLSVVHRPGESMCDVSKILA